MISVKRPFEQVSVFIDLMKLRLQIAMLIFDKIVILPKQKHF